MRRPRDVKGHVVILKIWHSAGKFAHRLASSQSVNFRKVIDFIRTDSLSEKEKRTGFERLIKLVLVSGPEDRAKIGIIWVWEDVPCSDQLGKGELGIGLIISGQSQKRH